MTAPPRTWQHRPGRLRFAQILRSPSPPVVLHLADAPVAVLLSLLAAAYAWWASSVFRDEILWSSWTSLDIYFHADVPTFLQVYASGVPRSPSHFALHPLLFPVVWLSGAIGRRLGASLVTSFRTSLAASSALGAGLLFFCARGIGAPTPLAAIGVLATMATATFTHWSGALDHFALAVPTIALPLTALAATRTTGIGAWIALTVVSATVTVSNAVMSLLAAVARVGVARGLAAFALALLTLTGLAGAWLLHVRFAVGRMFPPSDDPFGHLRFFHFLPTPDPPRPKFWDQDFPFDLWARLKGLTIYGWAAPDTLIRHRFALGQSWIISPSVLSYETAPLISLGWSGAVAALSFAALLTLGLASAARSPRRDVAFASLGFLAFHTVLHLFYGELVFLYAAHAIPSLAAIVAFALAGPWRRAAAAFALAFVVIGGPHNVARFQQAADLANLIARINLIGAEM